MELTKTLYEKQGKIAIVKFNQPKILNAIDDQVLDELCEIFENIDKDPDIRCAILTGEGQRAFSAGGDISEEIKKGCLEGYEFIKGFTRVNYLIEHIGVPVIAAINGYCLGGGMEIAYACDIRMAADNSKLGSPEVTLGLLPGVGGTQRLPRLVGESRAKLWVMTGDKYTAQQCLELGVVDLIVPADELMDKAIALAEKIASMPPLTIRYIKTAIHEGLQTDLDRALKMEGAMNAHLFATEDKHEACLAFLEKRPHKEWVGR